MKWDQQLLLSLWTVFSQLIFSKLALALEKRGCCRNFALGIFNAYPTTVVTYAMRWVKANSVTLQNYIHSVWKIKEKVSFYSKIASGANYIYHQIKYFQLFVYIFKDFSCLFTFLKKSAVCLHSLKNQLFVYIL